MSNYKITSTKILKSDYDALKAGGLNISAIIKRAILTSENFTHVDLTESPRKVDQAELIQTAFYAGKSADKIKAILEAHSANAFISKQRVVQILLHRFIEQIIQK